MKVSLNHICYENEILRNKLLQLMKSIHFSAAYHYFPSFLISDIITSLDQC
jgi:hypothetical protein